MKITTTAESGDIKSQSTHGPEHLTSERLPGSAATIADICAAITKLVEAVSETDGERDPQTGLPRVTAEDTDTLWRSVCEFAAQLSHAQSSSFDDINGKISVWRRLAPEQSLTSKYATIDETLLLSIIGDVERLHSGQTN